MPAPDPARDLTAITKRNVALGQLRRINRWLIAASVALTAVLSEAAAHAFPGKTVKASSAGSASKKAPSTAKRSGTRSTTTTSPQPLKTPAQAPKSTAQASEASSPVVSGGS
jgi:hypothetical protein